ncbi:YjgN family protein [Hellea balneolensis]|uniref:hypothetical protein n=1 Tax=Hellea balneolensis TaxID=287478 RepID=UPI000421A650|nr:hypothetical protein [Hellea balneolensis]
MVDQTPNPQELYEWQKPKPAFQFGRVMNRSFSGLFRNIKPIMIVILISLVVSSLVSAPMYFLDSTDPTALMQSPSYWIITAMSSVFGFLFFMFICVFTDHFAFAHFTNRPVKFRYVALRSLKLTIPILFIVVLYFIASYIGMIFLIVPGVIISVGWAIIGPSYLHEETSLFGSFGRSWELTRGYKWWVWLATIVMGIIMMIVFSLAAVLLSVTAYSGVTETDISSAFTVTAFLMGLLMSLSMYLALALYASFTTALYTELRELKEGPLAEEMSAVFD